MTTWRQTELVWHLPPADGSHFAGSASCSACQTRLCLPPGGLDVIELSQSQCSAALASAGLLLAPQAVHLAGRTVAAVRLDQPRLGA